MDKNISVIITLYKTPPNKLQLLKQYENYNLIIFDQGSKNNKKIISKILKKKFRYFYSKKNIGLSKSTNFLISKVKTKFFLFTQADIEINKDSIKNLLRTIKSKKDVIFAAPVIGQNSKKNLIKKYSYSNKLNAVVMLCDLKKVKKLGFFDENFFLYWEDVDLMERVKNSQFKMINVFNSYARHHGGESTIDNYKTKIVRQTNFKYGEFVFDLKYNKLRFLKIIRTLFQGIIFIPICLIIYDKDKLINYYSKISGTIKFIIFYFSKNNIRD